MPRKAPRARAPYNTGQPNGSAGGTIEQMVATGQPYGEAQRQTEQLRAAPLEVDGAAAAAAVASSPPPQAMLDAAQSFQLPNTSLTAPTERPNEPITAGLPLGAGPGPEAVTAPSPTKRVLDIIAEQTGDPYIQQLLDRARAMR